MELPKALLVDDYITAKDHHMHPVVQTLYPVGEAMNHTQRG